MPKQRAVIIGAGAGGLALANILAKAGMHVTVYEQNEGPGGRMGILQKHGFTFDTGPSWYLMKDVFEDYFQLFGKSTADYYELERLNPGYRVFYEQGKPITISADLDENIRTFESLEPGAGKRLEQYVENGERNYHAALSYFLYNPFIRIRSVVNADVLKAAPAFLRLFGQSLHSYVKRIFRVQILQQLLEYPSVFLGASPFNTPALYQLMSYLDFKEGVYYPKRKGMYAVTEALTDLGKELGVQYRYGESVEQIVVDGGVATGIVVNGKKISTDLVVSNADLQFTEQNLLPQKARSFSAAYWTKRKPGPSALLMYLGVKGELPELEHHNLFFVKNWRKNFEDIYTNKKWPKQASMYVSKTSATDTSTAPRGCQNIFVLVPLPAGGTGKTNVAKMVDHYLAQLERMSGIGDVRSRIVYKEIRTPEYFGEYFNAWQNTALGMSHTLRQSAMLRPSVKSKKVKNLYYVGAGSQPGIGVPMCIISAQLVYKYLVNDWSAGAPKKIKRVSV